MPSHAELKVVGSTSRSMNPKATIAADQKATMT
jgi:hypothetical protein